MVENDCLELRGRLRKQAEMMTEFMASTELSEAKRKNLSGIVQLLTKSELMLAEMWKIHYTSTVKLGECKQQIENQQELLDKLLNLQT
jgi:hypothetical protein